MNNSPDGWKLCSAQAQGACNAVSKGRNNFIDSAHLKSNFELLTFIANNFNPGMEKELLKLNQGQFASSVEQSYKNLDQAIRDYQTQTAYYVNEGKALIRKFILAAEAAAAK